MVTLKTKYQILNSQEIHDIPEIKAKGKYILYKITRKNTNLKDILSFIFKKGEINPNNSSFIQRKEGPIPNEIFISSLKPIKTPPKSWALTNLGKISHHISEDKFKGDQFKVSFKNILKNDALVIEENLSLIKWFGMPNYYGENAFNRYNKNGKFYVNLLIKGKYEEALKLFLQLSLENNSEDEVHKSYHSDLFQRKWKNWKHLKTKYNNSFKPLFNFLDNRPKDFFGCHNQITQNNKNKHIIAFQKYIWNFFVGEYINNIISDKHKNFLNINNQKLFYQQKFEPKHIRESLTSKFPVFVPKLKEKNSLYQWSINRVLKQQKINPKSLEKRIFKSFQWNNFKRTPIIYPEYSDLNISENLNRVNISFNLTIPKSSFINLVLKRILTFKEIYDYSIY